MSPVEDIYPQGERLFSLVKLKRIPINFLVYDFSDFKQICFEQIICRADKSSLCYLLNAPHRSSLVVSPL